MANLFKNMDASCRFCLRFFDMMIPIDEAIEKHFKELTSEDVRFIFKKIQYHPLICNLLFSAPG